MVHSRNKIVIIANVKKIGPSNFHLGFVVDLPWDPSKQSWKVVDGLGIVPFFGYSTKINYRRNKIHYKEILSFVSRL